MKNRSTSQKMISMPYQEYLDDLEKQWLQMHEEFLAPIKELIKLELRENDNGVKELTWKYNGSLEDLLIKLCEILEMPTIADLTVIKVAD